MPRNSSVTDTRLVRRSQEGDRRAFRALLTRYDWRLRGLAHALLLDTERVDAVLWAAYVRAWREVVRIDSREDAAAWLYRVVYNACIDELRRESTRIGAAPPTAPDVADTAEVADAEVAAADPPVQPQPAGGNGDVPATTSGRRAQVVEALAALAPADRVAVVLVDREGFAPEAAARILGLTPEVLEARLVGARAQLTNRLPDVLEAPTAPAEEPEPESQPDETEPEAEAEAQSEEPQPASEQPDADPDDATSADPADTKVASRSAASGSPNGSSGAASTNGSDDTGGGAT
jgi:RNA polymerase sigma-70 factor (ECF subfamily)